MFVNGIFEVWPYLIFREDKIMCLKLKDQIERFAVIYSCLHIDEKG